MVRWEGREDAGTEMMVRSEGEVWDRVGVEKRGRSLG